MPVRPHRLRLRLRRGRPPLCPLGLFLIFVGHTGVSIGYAATLANPTATWPKVLAFAGYVLMTGVIATKARKQVRLGQVTTRRLAAITDLCPPALAALAALAAAYALLLAGFLVAVVVPAAPAAVGLGVAGHVLVFAVVVIRMARGECPDPTPPGHRPTGS
jgi:hypothetical protein